MSPFNYKVATSVSVDGGPVQELRQSLVAERHDRGEMSTPNRWLPVVGGVMMNMALGMFYGMSVFMLPLEKEFGWTRAQTSWVTTIGLALIAVWYVDRRLHPGSPRAAAGGGRSAACSSASGSSSPATRSSLPMFYLTAGVIAGTGSGFGYVVPTSVGSKWFPDKRGLVIGLMVGGYGAGSGVFGPIALSLIDARRLAQHLSDPLARLPGDDDDRRVPAAEPAGRLRATRMGSVEGARRRARRRRRARVGDGADADVLGALDRLLPRHDGGDDGDQPAGAVRAQRRALGGGRRASRSPSARLAARRAVCCRDGCPTTPAA